MRLLRTLALAACLLLPSLATFGQVVTGAATLAVSGTTARVALPAVQQYTLIAPVLGATHQIFYKLGDVTVVAALTDAALPPGGICIFSGPNTYLAAIATGADTIYITQLSLCPQFSGRQ